MKYWIIAAAFAAACASPESAPTAAAQASEAPAPDYATDARSTASDEAVRDARRAYRSACQQNNNDEYCECMTGGMAQALTPTDLSVATADFSGQSSATPEQRARVEQTRAQVDEGCAQFR